MPNRPLCFGRARAAHDDTSTPSAFELPTHHLVTHGVIVGMTGSGKTGLCVGLIEETLRSRIPVLLIDIKGDLPNLGLLFDELDGPSFAPWVDLDAARRDGKSVEQASTEIAQRWRDGLAGWGLGPADVRALREGIDLRIITPGTTAGEPLHVLSPLEQGSELWEIDEEAARDALSAAISLLLRMVNREADPTRGHEHVLLSHLAERRLRAGKTAGLEDLLADLREPPIERVGALSVDEFLPPKERAELAKDLNALVASPSFSTWRQGAPLDVGAWMRGRDGDSRVPVTIVSVAHLEDEERMLVLSLVLEQALAWVRGLSGTTDLRALILFDEVFGFLPPHPSNPPTKKPLLSLLKQARAFGVGCLLATQNPIDLDYKALSNAGVWFVGRLQTDADRERVVEGLVGSDAAGAGADRLDSADIAAIIKALPPRTFFLRDVHAKTAAQLVETRFTLSWLRGPMTRQEIRRWTKENRPELAAAAAPVSQGTSSAPATASAAVSPPLPDAPRKAPELPVGWRALYPCAPASSTDQWSYLPYAAVLASAVIEDAKLGYHEMREASLMAPIDTGTVDIARADKLLRQDFLHPPTPGARHQPLGDAFRGKALKSIEKSLRDRVIAQARTTVYHSPELGLCSQPQEPRETFELRCVAAATNLALQERARLMAKYEPRLRKLILQRDAAREALAQASGMSGTGVVAIGASLLSGGVLRAAGRAATETRRAAEKTARLREKVQKAEADLAGALYERDSEIAARDAEVARAREQIVVRELAAKKGAVTIESFGIAWIPG